MNKVKMISTIIAVSVFAAAMATTALGANTKGVGAMQKGNNETRQAVMNKADQAQGQKMQKPMGKTIDEIKADIAKRVTDGKMTQAEADEKIAELDKRYEAFKADLATKVTEGKLTQEQADKILASGMMGFGRMQGGPAQQGEKPKTIDEIKADIAKRVTDGKMTQAEADEKIAELDKRYEAFKADLATKVTEGKLTQEQADKILASGMMGFGRMQGGPVKGQFQRKDGTPKV